MSFSFLILNHLGTGVAMSVAIYRPTQILFQPKPVILEKDLKPTNDVSTYLNSIFPASKQTIYTYKQRGFSLYQPVLHFYLLQRKLQQAW